MDKMTFAKPFGDMLKEKRKLRGLSQMGLAMKSGRSLRCIQYLEAGTQEPTLSTLYAIAHALDLRVMDLIEALPEELNICTTSPSNDDSGMSQTVSCC